MRRPPRRHHRSQMIAHHAPRPRRCFFGICSAGMPARRAADRRCAVTEGSTVSTATPVRVPDARIQHGVEDVDEEVHEHIADRDDRNQALDAMYCRAPIASKICLPRPGNP